MPKTGLTIAAIMYSNLGTALTNYLAVQLIWEMVVDAVQERGQA